MCESGGPEGSTFYGIEVEVAQRTLGGQQFQGARATSSPVPTNILLSAYARLPGLVWLKSVESERMCVLTFAQSI